MHFKTQYQIDTHMSRYKLFLKYYNGTKKRVHSKELKCTC
jgi:hypothetical protein